MRITACLFAFVFLFSAFSCIEKNSPEKPETPAMEDKPAVEYEFTVEDFFSLKLADGFAWPIAVDDKEKTVVAAAKGLVISVGNKGSADGKTICIEHRYVENAHLHTVYSVYQNLREINVQQGDEVNKQQPIGKTGSKAILFEIANDSTFVQLLSHPDTVSYADAKEFVKRHASTMIPAKEARLLIAVKHNYKMQSFRYGKLLKTYDIALSQSPLGHKQVEGDNKLPEGEYRIIQKTKGPFAGDYAEYLGPRFMRLNYPNNYDAENALKNKKITTKQAAQIISANNAKKEPNKNTGLGGGIGIHGWAGDWPANSRHLTWGCISMKNAELTELFDDIPLYTQILILP